MTEETISIIIPVYNIEKFLNKCVDSVLKQTYHNLEIILIDDGSTDKSGAICDDYKSKDNRIKVLHQLNGGLSSARNAGIEIANGEYLAFIDGDDYVEPTLIETLFNACKETNADLSICSFYMEGEDGKTRIECESLANASYTNIEALELLALPRQDRYVVAWNKLYKKHLFDEIRFPLNRVFEDQATVHKIFWNAKKIVTVSDKLYHYIVRDDSLSHKTNPIKYFDDLDALFERVEFYKQNNLEKLVPGVENVMFYLFGYYLNKSFCNGKLDKKIEEMYLNYGQKCLALVEECFSLHHYKRKELKKRKKLYNLSFNIRFKIKLKWKIKNCKFLKPLIKVYKFIKK